MVLMCMIFFVNSFGHWNRCSITILHKNLYKPCHVLASSSCCAELIRPVYLSVNEGHRIARLHFDTPYFFTCTFRIDSAQLLNGEFKTHPRSSPSDVIQHATFVTHRNRVATKPRSEREKVHCKSVGSFFVAVGV